MKNIIGIITEKILNNINEKRKNIILMQINFFSGYDICSHGGNYTAR